MPRFLVVQLARFGDLVQSGRLLASLLARGEVHLCLPDSLGALASLLYPEAVLHPLPVHGRPGPEAVQRVYDALRSLKGMAFDGVYNCNHSPLNLSLTRLFAGSRLYGCHMRGAQEYRDKWTRLLFRLTRQRTLTPLNLVDAWAHLDAAPCAPRAVAAPVRPAGEGRIGVVLAGREARRSLPVPILGQCVRTAFAAAQARHILLLGSRAETPLARRLMRALPAQLAGHVQDLSGKTSLGDLHALLPTLDMLLTPDTGTMHLAAHLGVPVRAFFLSSAWCHETGPYGAGHSVWQAASACAPCLESAPCRLGTICANPFAHKDFLRSLARDIQGRGSRGDEAALPAGLILYRSRLDALGVDFAPQAGNDARAASRAFVRARLAEYCHVPLPEPCAGLAADVREALTALVHDDAQWMLP